MTKCLYLMGRYEKNQICLSININENLLKEQKKSQKNHGGILAKVLISQFVLVLGV